MYATLCDSHQYITRTFNKSKLSTPQVETTQYGLLSCQRLELHSKLSINNFRSCCSKIRLNKTLEAKVATFT